MKYFYINQLNEDYNTMLFTGIHRDSLVKARAYIFETYLKDNKYHVNDFSIEEYLDDEYIRIHHYFTDKKLEDIQRAKVLEKELIELNRTYPECLICGEKFDVATKTNICDKCVKEL